MSCNESKPLDYFYTRKDGKRGAWCLQCNSQPNLYNSNADIQTLRDWLCIGCKECPEELNKYGLTLEEFKYLLAFEPNGCFACGGRNKSGRRLAIDHCHATNRVRGLLCNACNVALGKLRDNPPDESALAKYIFRANSTCYAKRYKVESQNNSLTYENASVSLTA